MIHFLDSSALVKRYIEERGSDRLRPLFRGKKELSASRLAEIEVTSALSRRVREGDLPLEQGQGHARQLLLDLRELRVVELRPPVLGIAGELVWRHALRAYDALQLASALRLANATRLAVTFWCADQTLSDCANAEWLWAQRI